MSCWKVNSITLGGGGDQDAAQLQTGIATRPGGVGSTQDLLPLNNQQWLSQEVLGHLHKHAATSASPEFPHQLNTSERHRNYTALLCAQKFNKHLQLEGTAIKMLAPPTTRTW